jgi:hypothetical protein
MPRRSCTTASGSARTEKHPRKNTTSGNFRIRERAALEIIVVDIASTIAVSAERSNPTSAVFAGSNEKR